MSSENYEISSKAKGDLRSIWKYTLETWSVDQAKRYYILLFDEINYIASNFESARKVDYIRNGYRISKVKSHLIFYKQQKSGIILIVRILHQRMDIESRL